MEEERGQRVLRLVGAVAPGFSVLQGREMPPGGQTPFSCQGGAVRPASPSGVALSFPCVPSPEVRALSRRAAFLERVLCSPCQAGRPRGAGGAKLWNVSCPPVPKIE